MTIWILYRGKWDMRCIWCIFSTEEKMDKFIKEQGIVGTPDSEEHELEIDQQDLWELTDKLGDPV